MEIQGVNFFGNWPVLPSDELQPALTKLMYVSVDFTTTLQQH